MAVQLQIANGDGVASIEDKLAAITSQLTPSRSRPLVARISSERRHTFFKDIWASIALATGLDAANTTDVTAWGLQDWSGLDNMDGFALSHPSLISMQRGASIKTDKEPRQALDVEAVRRLVSNARGVLGTDGARQRTIVEFDPQSPRAEVLSSWGRDQRATFFDFMREALHLLEIGARESGAPGRELGQRATGSPRTQIIEWLFELYTNGFEHAQLEGSVRLFRVQKHPYPDRTRALRHAKGMPELARYIESQAERPTNNAFNLVEASVSDFGPGIVDGFLQSPAGKGYRDRSRRDLLGSLLHEQLSCKSNDPSAGLGIRNTLDAARRLDAFVSLRTGEFSLTMPGRLNPDASLTFGGGPLPYVVGTHWQLLLPDRSGQP